MPGKKLKNLIRIQILSLLLKIKNLLKSLKCVSFNDFGKQLSVLKTIVISESNNLIYISIFAYSFDFGEIFYVQKHSMVITSPDIAIDNSFCRDHWYILKG